MVNSDSSIEVYCTRPNCDQPQNLIPEQSLTSTSIREQCCSKCGMPLILGGHFLPLGLLVSDEERGGFGRTFLARDISFPHRPLRVIKQLHPRNPSGRVLNPSELQRIEQLFQREANILAELNHQQIPRAWAFFVVEADHETSHPQKFFYLVQDYIEGQDLAQILKKKGQFLEDEVVHILKEILKILQYIHNFDENRGAIHRDIKPANIMRRRRDGLLYLIDFGAVRQVVEGLPADTSSVVLTPGFAPPEQFAGEKVSPASDLYALAATCVCLLTGGGNPRELLLNSNWRQYTNVSNQSLATVLDSMLKYKQEDRPQSAQEVLDALSTKQQPNLLQKFLDWLKGIPRRKRWISLGGLALLGLAIAVILHWAIQANTSNPLVKQPTETPLSRPSTPTPPPPFAEYFSRGEEALIAEAQAVATIPECRTAYDLKKQGMEAFANASSPADFRTAEDAFFKSIKEFKNAYNKTKTSSSENKCHIDPETWIYYYNSKVAQTQLAINGSLPTIAVVISGLEDERGDSLEILRGIAQVQSEQESAPVLQILIAKYDSQQQEVEYIAEQNIPGDLQYFSNSKILGVVGRYSSHEILKPGDIFGKKQLVLISPTSTAIRRYDFHNQQRLNEYVFRTASNDSIAAKDLANYMRSNSQWQKVLIGFDSENNYSKSLKDEFEQELRRLGAIYKNITGCDLKRADALQLCKDKAKEENVQVLMLAPSADTLKKALNIVKEVKLQKRNRQILGGDVLYDTQTLDLGDVVDVADDMVVAVSSHASLANTNFIGTATKLWGTSDVSWRTLTSYDAAKVFVKALTDLRNQGNNNPTSQQVYEKLKEPSFLVLGATANIEFDEQHDRKQVKNIGILVQAQYNPKTNKYRFNHLKSPERNNP
ncbi:protein kinase [Nostocaceae cyanobacterium CENA357]|uniref:non-specific serine/threonine protein kinase n=1 Tax=Atlanticothrix silvestris CENA357 TaxID=1725252 RepID=A0A8J7HGU5_9CYAN|nr:bifunctional serine/threonine-protein kinase/ABC transporter substrate-binding protein [Atlanticothrix silvestris]MBH8555383.1 protein kinase [Atlanticothrix silvestris CENA357]